MTRERRRLSHHEVASTMIPRRSARKLDSTLGRWHRISLIVLVASLLHPLVAVAESQNLDGNWQLDWDQSEPFAPALEAMEVGWLMRRLAGVARVDIGIQSLEPECDVCPERLEISFSSPISTRSEVVQLDHVPRPGKDPQGNPTIDRYKRTDGGGVEMVRELVLPSGKKARLIEAREIGTEPDSLISVLTVFVDGDQRAKIRRVFNRIPDGDDD
jgi:hypothetical protein